MSKSLYLLVDCNNFFASCERLFRPDLNGVPILTVSNNDGCVVSRSKEAKELGIKMGAPLFQLKHEIKKHGIAVFSSNYTLYGDISARVMSIIEEACPIFECYSIDEGFGYFSGSCDSIDFVEFGTALKNKILQWTGMPVCVGIAPTKTLAKLANYGAKKWPATEGVVYLESTERQRKLLSLVPVGDIWGIGRKISKKLNDMGIITGLDFANAPQKMIRQQFSVVLERTHRELNGDSCLEIEEIPPTKKQIVCSRSFGQKINSKTDLAQAIAKFVTQACSKLRNEKQKAKVISIFITTGYFAKNSEPYTGSRGAELILPSDDTRDFLLLASVLLDAIWRDGIEYAKAGCMLMDFYDPIAGQQDLFNQPQEDSPLMSLIDSINGSGIGNVTFGSTLGASKADMKRERLSPSYTTNINQLPIAK